MDMPKVDSITTKKKGKVTQDIGPLPWNSLERIISLIDPSRMEFFQRYTSFKLTEVSEHQQFTLTVPGS